MVIEWFLGCWSAKIGGNGLESATSPAFWADYTL
jgi:hypothetical protein